MKLSTGVLTAAKLVLAGDSVSRGGSAQRAGSPDLWHLAGSAPNLGVGDRVGGGGPIVLQSETEIPACSKPPPDPASKRQDTALSGGEVLVKPPS